jgi:hypothetical protein
MKVEKDYNGQHYAVARSTDLGESFLRDTIASVLSGNTVCECSPAALVASGSAGILLYRNKEGHLRDIWGGISNNGCQSFSNGIQIDSTLYRPVTCPASGPAGVIVGDTLYSVFMSGSDENGLVYLGKLSLSKSTLSVVPVTGSIASVVMQNFPRIAGINNAAAIVWTQTSGGNNQVCLSFTGDISYFGFSQAYDTVAEGVMLNADVAIGGGYVYVVWEDQVTRSVMYKRGVYIRRRTDEENTSILINQPQKGQKYFSVVMQGISSCTLVENNGNLVELDVSYPKNKDVCKVDIDGIDEGTYTVKFWDNDGKIYTAKLEIK